MVWIDHGEWKVGEQAKRLTGFDHAEIAGVQITD